MRTLKDILALVAIVLWLCVASHAAEKRAEVVPLPAKAKAEPVEDGNALVVVVHEAEKRVEIDLVIGLDCDCAKIVAKHGEIKPGTKAWEKLHELIAEKLQEAGEHLVKESAKRKPAAKPAEAVKVLK